MKTNLIEHLAATRESYHDRTGRYPERLFIGKWDMRELCEELAEHGGFGTNSPVELFMLARTPGEVRIYEATVSVDPRIGRMAGALWWAP